MRRLQHTHAIAKLYSLQFNTVPCYQDYWLDLPTNIEPEIDLLLQTYQDVFSVPSGLPPTRSHNHSIPLLHGADPIKVKPYRYPLSQKQQIEIWFKICCTRALLCLVQVLFLVPSSW